MNATTPQQSVSVEEVLNALFSASGGVVRLVAGSEEEDFFRRVQAGWISVRQYGAGERPERLAAHAWPGRADVCFSPWPWASPAIGSAPLPAAALWVRLPFRVRAPEPHHPAPGVDPASEAEARARLGALPVAPSFTIHEGDALALFWLLASPLDPDRARRLLRRLAQAAGGDPALADPRAALLRVPNTRNEAIYPSRLVTVEGWQPERRYGLEDLERVIGWLPGAK